MLIVIVCTDGTQQRGNYRELFPVSGSYNDSGDTTSGHVLQSSNGSLFIDGAMRGDAGFYLCQASNGVGADISKVVLLDVHSKSTIVFALNS